MSKRQRPLHNATYYNINYYITDSVPQHLLDLGFARIRDGQNETFIYTFPALKYNNVTVLRAKITVYPNTKQIRIDVTDNNYAPYAPFYNVEFGIYNTIIKQINSAILNRFAQLGIKKLKGEKNNGYKNQKTSRYSKNTHETA